MRSLIETSHEQILMGFLWPAEDSTEELSRGEVIVWRGWASLTLIREGRGGLRS
jgi:hypothetical protein